MCDIVSEELDVVGVCVVVQVSLLVRRELYERAKDFNIILDDVSITELSFSSQYTAAVEAKQVGKARCSSLSTCLLYVAQ